MFHIVNSNFVGFDMNITVFNLMFHLGVKTCSLDYLNYESILKLF